MGFCGSVEGSFSVEKGVFSNVCFVDTLNLIPHCILLIVTLMVLVIWRQSVFGRLKVKTWVHFQVHTSRYFFTFILILVNSIEIIEAIISDYLDPAAVRYHVVLLPCIDLLSSVASIVFYHNVEMWNSPRFLLVLLVYWMGALTLKIIRILSMTTNNIELGHMRAWLTATDAFVYGILLCLELNVLRVQRYAFFARPKRVRPPEELEHVTYRQAFVNLFSKCTFWWVTDFLVQGFKHPIDSHQLGKLPKSEQAFTQYRKLWKAFEEEKLKASQKNTEPSLHRIYLKAFWPILLLAGLYRLIGDLLAFIGPWCIEMIVDFAYAVVENKTTITSCSGDVLYSVGQNTTIMTMAAANSNDTCQQPYPFYISVSDFMSNGYTLCALIFIVTLIQHTLLQNHHYLVIREGVRLRSALQAMIYTKSLKLSSLVLSDGTTTLGQIMNHMSTDASSLMSLFFYIHYIWATPLQLVIALILMYFKLGISAVIGGLLVIISAPFQIMIGHGMSKMQKKVMQQSDIRVKRSNEMVQGMKVIKLLAWESIFFKEISDTRKVEVKYLLYIAVYRALFTFVGTSVTALGTMLTFVLYSYLEDTPLTAGKAMSTLALFNILSVPLVLFVLFTTAVITANVSAKRLIPYFLAQEVEGMQGHETRRSSSVNSDSGLEHIRMEPLVHAGIRKSFDSLAGSIASLNSNTPHMLHHTCNSNSASLQDILDHHGKRLCLTRPASSIGLSVSDQSEHRRHRHSSSGIEDTEVTDNHSLTLDSHCAVEIKDGRYSWDLKTRELTLKNINIKIPAEKLTMIVGPVGSGKTSLLSAMLGEMLTVSGSMEWSRNCRISYVAQRPWLLNTTLKENILFGQTYVWRRYRKVIDACALQPDINMLPFGENTEIGEKGVNLSGGQKQRISIARALYSHSDTVLLDDPLSALDVHVGCHVFEEVILRKLLKRRKTVILVTHQLQYLSFAHHIIVMRDGEIQYQGKLVDVKKNDPDLYSSWRKALKEASIQETKQYAVKRRGKRKEQPEPLEDVIIGGKTEQQSSYLAQMSVESNFSDTRHISQGEESGIDGKLLEDVDEEKEEDLNEESLPSGKLIRNEHREVGAVKMSVYLCYMKACGILLCIFVVLMLLLNQGLLVTTNFWLSIWSSASTKYYDNQQTNSTATFDNSHYLHVYVILFAFAVASTLASGIILQFTGVRGARCLHDKLLTTILNVPIRFFDTNSSGRIINRFSSDVGQVDQKIPGTWDALLRCCLAVFSAIIVNSIGTPYFILAAIPLIFLYYCLQVFFRATSRELQRLDSVTKSPIFSQFSETLNGLVTIRAYRAQTRFQNETLARIDSNVAPFLFNQTANRWLGIRLPTAQTQILHYMTADLDLCILDLQDYMGAVLVGIASIASLMSGVKGNTNPAFIGLCIAYALMVSNYLNWIVRNIAELEMLMNSTERVDEYTKLQREPQSSSNDNPGKDWPSQGEIHFKNVSLTYDTDLDSVVMGVSFTVRPGEKIGVCGRTGSGKTSLTLALFRMIKITTGEIIIDGRDISSVPLSVLRSKLAIIPQDPVLFTGTIRHNLDPLGEIPDTKLWEALQTVELKDTIETLEGQLDASVSEGGENFSVGQKQLFCLARAFLRNNTILVLDEATASIDLETDNKLQHVVSNVFRDKTVITVAHRISTIMKYDRVMVMDMGKVVEFDTPQNLMEDSCSHFYGLVHQTRKG